MHLLRSALGPSTSAMFRNSTSATLGAALKETAISLVYRCMALQRMQPLALITLWVFQCNRPKCTLENPDCAPLRTSVRCTPLDRGFIRN